MESAQNNMIERSEVNAEPKVPLFITIEKEAIKSNPDHEVSIKRAFEVMNRQFFANYQIFSSEERKGVKFAHTTLTIDRSVIEEIGELPHLEKHERQVNKNEEIFTEPSFALPIEGDPSTSADVAAYLFFQKLTTVATALKRGEEPGSVNIHIYGQPEGQHGSSSAGFLGRMWTSRFNEHGRVYAELTRNLLTGVDLDNTRFRFQGSSKGSVTVDKTTKYLPDEVKDKAVRLYDNPAGIHSGILRAAKALNELGIIVDIGRLMVKEPLLKDISEPRKEYEKYLKEVKGLTNQTKKEQIINWLTFIAEMVPLAVGNTPEDKATAVTSRLDVTNVKRRVFSKLLSNRNRSKPLLMYQDGKTKIAPIETNASHAYNLIHKMLEPGRIGKRMQVIEDLTKTQTSQATVK